MLCLNFKKKSKVATNKKCLISFNFLHGDTCINKKTTKCFIKSDTSRECNEYKSLLKFFGGSRQKHGSIPHISLRLRDQCFWRDFLFVVIK